ncbi:MAG: beta-galactosidase [Bacteroidaceae bacterium]|nr:beta-galactosidase [Bacteroidaceae bacterium]
MLRPLIISLFSLFLTSNAYAQKATAVTQEVMDFVYQQSRTPHKFGLVVAPTTNREKYDCPTVFRKGDKWLMTFVCYNGSGGNDGRGYETWLAESQDLLHWNIKGRVLEYATDPKAWDLNQRGGFPALIDHRWGGSYEMQQYKGRNYITYIGGAGRGYEAVEQPLSIGIASTDKDIATAHPWECADKPLMSYSDKDAQWWEYMTQYKSTIYKMDKKWFGAPYVMFYNAGGKDDTHPKGERIGVATSKDMKKWKRYPGNPVFAHDSDGTITGDAQIVWMDIPSTVSKSGGKGIWVMYYFSAFNPTREYNAYNTFAVSSDLKNWTDWNGEDLIIPSKPYDEMFAHKSYVVKWEDTVYHFYCAVNNSGQRGIAVATSQPMGKSEVNFPEPDPTGKRTIINLGEDWKPSSKDSTIMGKLEDGKSFNVPFNLDDYYGTHQGEHGNLHGEATFVKHFTLNTTTTPKRYFLRFEGVGTYADITLNNKHLGHYDIGRTVETIDATEAINTNGNNILEVKISHPSNITDMPWVCGGCSSEWGFSEGSQPFGIFRPVTLEITDDVRIEPFGTHIWASETLDSVFVDTEVKNYSDKEVTFQLVSKIAEKSGKQFARITDDISLKAGESKVVRQQTAISNPKLWTQEKPYLYTLQSMIKRNGKATDDYPVQFGFRTARWPSIYYQNYKSTKSSAENSTTIKKSPLREDLGGTFLLNGTPIYINGVCEYEHLYGQSHAFHNEQIDARIKQVKDLGFNAFRDAHQPHNLRYGNRLQEEGILWWPQFSAHIWYDTPQFRESFKRHLVQWVKERRNSPAVVLWGLQNESTLPKDFAEECSNIIRSLDPTCGRDRLITTCNGGEGTDWNVVQNWSGTYGGDVNNYGNELKRTDQLLNGEYGAWRTLGNHSGNGYTEEKQADLLEHKCQQAESVKDSICGQFLWLLGTHDNPGRRQPDEAFRRIDKVGPYNYKGLMSPWEQPVSSYYMYKSRYTPFEKEPVCYIVRDIYNGIKPTNGVIDSLRVYSNCHELSLTAGNETVATMSKPSNSSLFVFKNINVKDATILRAEGKGVFDEIAIDNGKTSIFSLTEEPMEDAVKPSMLNSPLVNIKINCGGDACGEYIQDPTEIFPASQCYDATLPLPEIYKTARFGRHNIGYTFNVTKGATYEIKLHFIEPWYGASRSEQSDYEGFRIFDVAFNNKTVINDLDIWAQAGFGKPYIRTVGWTADADTLRIHFPEAKAGQAIISAISISPISSSVNSQTANNDKLSIANSPRINDLSFWSNLSKDLIAQMPDSLLPPKAASALQVEPIINKDKKGNIKSVTYTYSVGVAKVYALRFRYWNGEAPRNLHVSVKDKNGVSYVDSDVAFLQSQMKKTKRKMTSITTGSQTNAGTYTVTITGEGLDKMDFDALTID